MAMVNGLRIYAISTMNADAGGKQITPEALVPQEIVSLMNPARNYSAYRQHYQKNPGIPFLIPHIRDMKQNDETAIQPVLKFLQSARNLQK